MKTKFHPLPSHRGFTAVEAVIVVAMFVVLAGLLLPGLMTPKGNRSRGHRISCVNDLKQVGLAMRIYANDNNDRYPMMVPEAEGGAMEAVERGEVFRIFQVLSNELSIPMTVVCPTDLRIAATNWSSFNNGNLSFFVGVDATDVKPDMILSGDRNLGESSTTAPPDYLYSGMQTLGTNPLNTAWSDHLHRKAGNVGLADGSVQQLNRQMLWQQLANSGDATNRLLFPQ